MPTRLKEPTLRQSPVRHAPQHSGELPEMPLPSHPLLGKEPLTDAQVSEDAPHPIGVDPSVTGAFSTISAEDGTAPFTIGSTGSHERVHPAQAPGAPRHGHRAAEPGRRDFPRIAIILIAALAVCLIAAAILILGNLAGGSSAPAEGEGQHLEQTEAAPGQPLYYDSYAYTLLQQSDGRWAFVRSAPTGSDPLVLFTLDGSPVELVFRQGTFLVPENLDGSWDVAAWTMGDGAIVTRLSNGDGSPIEGEGQLASAALEGETLALTAEDGTVTRVPLDF